MRGLSRSLPDLVLPPYDVALQTCQGTDYIGSLFLLGTLNLSKVSPRSFTI